MNAMRWAVNWVGDLAEHAALIWKMPSLSATCAVSTLSPPWLDTAHPVAAAIPDTEANELVPEQQNDLSVNTLPQLPVCRQRCFSCVQLCNPRDSSLPDSSVHGILQTRILEVVAMPSFRGSSWPRDQAHVSYVSCTARRSLPLVLPGKPILPRLACSKWTAASVTSFILLVNKHCSSPLS